MGLIRFIYALAVVVLHASIPLGFTLLSRNLAVWSFFIISGFYMALILNEKYIDKKGSYKLFITNRILRIYPIYLITLLLTFLLCSYLQYHRIPNPMEEYLKASTSTSQHILDVFRNITLIITLDYFVNLKSNANFLLLAQAWTLQLEMLFYLTAPFIFRKSWKVLVAVLVAVLLFDYLFVFPYKYLNEFPIVYRYFANIIFFLMGGISYKLYVKYSKKPWNTKIMLFIFLGFVSLTLFYNYFQIKIPFISSTHHTDWAYYLLLMITIPIIFSFTKKSRLDKAIGELSYPIYISHTFILAIIIGFIPIITISSYFVVVLIAATLIYSILLVFLIDRPLDILRQKRFASANLRPKNEKVSNTHQGGKRIKHSH